MTIPAPTPRKGFIKVLLPVVVIVCAVFIVLSFLKSQVPSRSNLEADPAAAHTAEEAQPKASIGGIAPDFDLAPIGGAKAAKLADFRAKLLVVNFWATWCEACMEEMPSLVQMREAYKSKGVEVIGIDLDENASTVVPRAAAQYKMAFPIYLDPDNKLTDYFDIHAIPVSVVMGAADRKILYIETGERNWNDQETRNLIDKWLNGK